MNWLYRRSLSLKSQSSLVEIYSRLTHLIAKEDSREEFFKKKYVGTVYEKGFKLKKPYSKSFSNPRYSCEFVSKITSTNDYTLIEIKMHPNDLMVLTFRILTVLIFILILNTIIPFSGIPTLNSIWSILLLAAVLIFYFGNLFIFNRQFKVISSELRSELNAEEL
jgi:hypothetical protein